MLLLHPSWDCSLSPLLTKFLPPHPSHVLLGCVGLQVMRFMKDIEAFPLYLCVYSPVCGRVWGCARGWVGTAVSGALG